MRLFNEHLQAALFLNHPYGVPIIGWMHELEALNYDDAMAFYKQHYAPNNAVLVVAGDVTPEGVKTLAEQYYGVLPANRPSRRAHADKSRPTGQPAA